MLIEPHYTAAVSVPKVPDDDLHLMVLLWQQQRTRDLALALADRNRANAKDRK